MEFPIITADQRRAQKKGIKGVIFGKSGCGKTSLLWTLPAKTTLFFDMEASDLSVEDWSGDTFRPQTWQECRDFAAFVGGPDPSMREDQSYSQAHYDSVCEKYGDPSELDCYDTIFIDSIIVAGRLCFQWCKGQPQAFSERTSKPDTRGAYGLQGQKMIAWLTHLQKASHLHDALSVGRCFWKMSSDSILCCPNMTLFFSFCLTLHVQSLVGHADRASNVFLKTTI